jgi:hypothetical protein
MVKSIGKCFIFAYHLVYLAWILSDFNYWEKELLYLFGQFSIGLFKLTGFVMPISGKYIAIHSAVILQAFSTVGIILLFSGWFGSKKSLQLLSVIFVIVALLHDIPITNVKIRDPNTYALRFLIRISASAGLLI